MVVRPLGVLEPLPLVVVRTGHTAVRQGEPCPDLWVVESGVLEARVLDADGRRFLYDVLGPGDAIGQLDEHPAAWTATALRPSRLRPVRGRDASAALAAQAARAVHLASELAWHGVADRIERRLIDLAERIGRPIHGGAAIGLRLTQDDLASMVGASRESANRAIRALVERGGLEVHGRGRYVVRAQLRLVADGR